MSRKSAIKSNRYLTSAYLVMGIVSPLLFFYDTYIELNKNYDASTQIYTNWVNK
jgi:hypothetical protein